MLKEEPNLFSEIPTGAPINKVKLGGQNKRLYDWLMAGNKIHCMHPAKVELRIGYLNSRCSDLINKHGIDVKSEYIEVEHGGEKTFVKQYWIEK